MKDYLDPPMIPDDDLHTLIELGYASKDRAIREATGRVDTWKHRLTWFIHTLRMKQTRSDEAVGPAVLTISRAALRTGESWNRANSRVPLQFAKFSDRRSSRGRMIHSPKS